MLSWADKLIHEYTGGRQDLRKRADRMDRDNPIEINDLKQVNSMIESMTFSLEWMTTGRQPSTFRGVDEKAVYQRRSYENIDLIPDIAEQLEILKVYYDSTTKREKNNRQNWFSKVRIG